VTTRVRTYLERICGGIGALALFATMWLTFFDVGGRKFLSQSITGSLELTEMLMVVVIFSSLPLVSLREEHVVFGSLDGIWPATFKRVQRFVVQSVCGACLLWTGWLMWAEGTEVRAAGEVSAQLLIPRFPFLDLIGVCAFLAGLIHIALAWTPAPANNAHG